jgi:hypothetical protein
LYDVLLVNQNATLDEIKLAFKKRALQVHPDKGGSKDAFHLVYQALEILADPEARQKYDQSLSRVNRRSEVDLQQTSPAGKKKTSKKRTQPSGQRETCPQPKRPTEPKKKPTADAGSTGNEPEANQPPQSKQTKLVKRIRDLLKQLPRDLRNDAITKHFSQKQRLILEKWMVDTLSASQEGETVVTTNQAARVRDIPTIESPNGLLYHGSCHTPFLPSVPSLPSLPAVSNSYRPNMSRMSRKKTAECKMKDSKDPNAKMRRTTGSGYLKKQGVSYAAGLCFDAIDIYTKTCDLQTSLEYLLVLTAVKQKMRDPESASASCEERLQGALMSSAKEHGKDLADLNLRFCILQTTGFLIKPGFLLRSPTVRSAEELGKLRALLEPFRRYGRYALSSGQKNLFWRFSPAQMQDAWEKFQKAVADAWNIAGADSTGFLQKVRAIHEAEIEHRTMDLQKWEREHMALQDKNKHRPTKLRERNGFAHLERWERQQMAMEDKNKHRPQK